MRLLLDECVPKRLKRELPTHEAKTVQDMGWAGVKNGALLALADAQFDAFPTVAQGIEYQQKQLASELLWARFARFISFARS